jgi:hypothetical protein
MDSQTNGMVRIAIASSKDGKVVPFESAGQYTIVKLERGEIISTETRTGGLESVHELYEALEDCSLAVAADIKEETQAQLVEHDINPIITDLGCVDNVVTAKLADRLKGINKSGEERT